MSNNLKAPQLLIILLLSSTLGFSQTDKFIWASFSAWEKVANLHCQMNGNPARCFKDIFSDKFNSPQEVIYAQIELMVWGWWNICSIQNIPTLTCEIRINKEFKKLFIKVKNLGCIEGE